MTRSQPSRCAALLLRFIASEHDALAGDLAEEIHAGRPARWVWPQLVRASALTMWAKIQPASDIQLVTISPDDSAGRTFPLLDPAPMQLRGRRLRGVGGAGLLGTIMLITLVMPQAGFLVVAGVFGGLVIGIVLVRRRRAQGLSSPAAQRVLGIYRVRGFRRVRGVRGVRGVR